jgi:hypothetical protein
MPAPATDAPPAAAALLERWLLRHGHDLHARAVADVDDTEALRKALGHDPAINTSQLYALHNTAQANPLKELRTFVRERGSRRRKVEKHEAADFWEALSDKLDILEEEEAAQAAEAASAGGGASPEDDDIDERARLLVTRAYVGHLVAHGRYLNGLHGS